jgi:hypothetical protein
MPTVPFRSQKRRYLIRFHRNFAHIPTLVGRYNDVDHVDNSREVLMHSLTMQLEPQDVTVDFIDRILSCIARLSTV